ncbi:hypothetical protein F0L68_34480 [Solihabitans fulvus]|uniref:Cobyrinic acid a,c-diamide synthase n=1 Tax=Solihabitans fulvus TaxID=1892852 RepID=A0A5B2WQY7_9PSEU|nr:hypothetical protein [Solihabitans fulvus]KAA2252869.1 hypothetical protein F0L68_34480 [Solihabitans fulvus]
MTRRPSLPGAAELFRPTSLPHALASVESTAAPETTPEPRRPEPDTATPRRGTGRQKHDSKITVYVSDEELLDLEHARLSLRAQHALAVDRGRVVREAVAIILADLEEHGEDSLLVRRLHSGRERGSQ